MRLLAAVTLASGLGLVLGVPTPNAESSSALTKSFGDLLHSTARITLQNAPDIDDDSLDSSDGPAPQAPFPVQNTNNNNNNYSPPPQNNYPQSNNQGSYPPQNNYPAQPNNAPQNINYPPQGSNAGILQDPHQTGLNSLNNFDYSLADKAPPPQQYINAPQQSSYQPQQSYPPPQQQQSYPPPQQQQNYAPPQQQNYAPPPQQQNYPPPPQQQAPPQGYAPQQNYVPQQENAPQQGYAAQQNYAPQRQPSYAPPQQDYSQQQQQQGGNGQQGYYPPPPMVPRPLGNIPDQFRILEGDTVVLLNAIRDYTGNEQQANKLLEVEKRLESDFEDAITVVATTPYSITNFIKAQPSILKILKNCGEVAKELQARRDIIKYYGGASFLQYALQRQVDLGHRLEQTILNKSPAIVRFGATQEFKIFYKTLGQAIANW